jgi:hypothetical protein
LKVLGGTDTTDESIWIADFANDDDGSLKIKQVEQFTDSNSYLDIFQAAKANK